MSATHAFELLRPGLLEGCSILVAGAAHTGSSGTLGSSVGAACLGLGARVSTCELDADAARELDDAAAEQLVERALAERDAVDLLAIDAAGLFSAAQAESAEETGAGAREALRVCLDASWNITRAVANRAFLRSEGGRIVYLAPVGDAGEHADAALAGLENLARTLSIEWARHGINTVAIAPGSHAAAANEVAALTAYLASPAGAYFSGCVLDLRGPLPHT
jgi:NAD(P)-dependent dehydrogenase (short-subunit alcohol dehydrogenase family)